MRAKGNGREKWVLGVAVVLTAYLVVVLCGSAQAFPRKLAAGSTLTVGLKSDGTVVAVGYNGWGQLNVGSWSGIVEVAAGGWSTVGLKSDGTVVAVGTNIHGELDVGSWSNIVQVASGGSYTVGLRSDGTVVAAGNDNLWGQLDVGSWSGIVQVSAGGVHTVGLKADGTVVAVGYNGGGQLNVGSWSGIAQVAAGYSHTVGLKADGTVVAVGDNSYGQLDVGSWSGIVQVAAESDHTVGLKADGTVVAVGRNSWGQLNVGSWSSIAQVATGSEHTVGLKSDGTVVAVGTDSYGKLNVGTWNLGAAFRAQPEVAAGNFHTVGLKYDGTVKAVGSNSWGELNVGSWSNIEQVAAGDTHTVGLKSDGTVVAVGKNTRGQLDVGSWSGIVQVAAGGWRTVGLKADGTVVAVGDNTYGQLDVGSWSGIVQVAAGGYHTVGLKYDGTVVAVGSNVDGRLDVDSWSNIVQVAAGWFHTVGLKSDGTVVAVGRNVGGQLDVGSWSSIVQVSAGGEHTVGLKSNGTVVAVGYSAYGQLNVGSWSGIVQVAAGYDHTVGLKSDGSVKAVGRNVEGQLNVATWNLGPAIRVQPEVAAGDAHTVGLKSDGTVVAVGNNFAGQLNLSSWSGIVQVAAGGWHTVGLKSDGTVVAVGRNVDGQLNVSSWSNIVQVAAGTGHTVGLKSDGTVVGVGDNSLGQLNISSWSNIMQVAARGYHTVGLKPDGTVVGAGPNSLGELNVGAWSGIVQVAAGFDHTVGLKSDGTVVAVGDNGDGQLNVGSWSNIVQVAAGGEHTVGLKSNGTVVAVGYSAYGQLNVGSWSGIVQVAAGGFHTVGLRSDGTVVAVGRNSGGQLNVATWVLGTSLPDLIETAVSNPPAGATPGSSFSVTDTVKNQGNAPSGASITSYYLSSDTTKGSGDILLTGSRSVPSLASGATNTGTITVTIPSSTVSGSYYLLACADDTNLAQEINENNNCIASVSKVAISVLIADLIETAVSNPPASAAAGSSFSVTDTVKNQGTGSAGASITSYYLSLDTVKGGGDILLTGSRSVPSLAPNGTNTGTITVTIPCNTVPGSYYLLACADDTNLVVESNESNNCIVSASKVNVTMVAPSFPSLISPSGTIATQSPTYTWNAVCNAADYYLWVNDSSGNRIQQLFTAAACGCGSGTGTCSISPAIVLKLGAGQWWVYAKNAAGSSSWSAAMNFTVVPITIQTAPAPLSPAQGSTVTTATPPYSWSALSAATHYYLSVDDPTGNRILQGYTASEAGCGSGTGNCTVTPTTTLSSGACNWKVRTWNSSGYGPWSTVVNFTVNVPQPPITPTAISPTGTIATITPTLSWNAVFNATEYNVEIWGRAQTGWLTATNCGCSAGTGTCSYTVGTPLNIGVNWWRVQARNGAGTSAWSAWVSFTIQIPLTAPTPVSPAEGSTITTATPSYSWTAVPAATYYYLSVNDPTGNRVLQWYDASAAGCGSGTGNCSVTPTTTLSSGACNWRVQGWNSSSGNGPWSTQINFTTNVPEPKATPVSPTGTITTATPPYVWNAVSGSTWYRLSVDDSTGNRIFQWYIASDAGCSSGTGNCTVTPTTVLAAGAAKWKVQTWVNGAAGPWSNEMAFTVNVTQPPPPPTGPPAAATLVSPSGSIATRTPTYTWNAVSNSTWYNLYVNDSTGNRIQQWYTAAAVGCGSGAGTCSITPATTLNPGAGRWWIQTYNSYGAGPWSAPMNFTVP